MYYRISISHRTAPRTPGPAAGRSAANMYSVRRSGSPTRAKPPPGGRVALPTAGGTRGTVAAAERCPRSPSPSSV